MPRPEYGIKSLADKRYYHFVVARSTRKLNLKTIWDLVGDCRTPGRQLSNESTGALVHRKLRSPIAYGRGSLLAALSEKGAGNPPYLYDVFVGEIQQKEERLLMIGAPFAGLAATLADKMIRAGGGAASKHFVGTNVPRVISRMEEGAELTHQGLSSHIVGVQFKMLSDKCLTTVRLGGDDPLSAHIYRDYLRGKASVGATPDECVLSCQKEVAGDGTARSRKLSRSRLHVDESGNFRFYVHISCGNVGLLPLSIAQLSAERCLTDVHGNPVYRLPTEDLE